MAGEYERNGKWYSANGRPVPIGYDPNWKGATNNSGVSATDPSTFKQEFENLVAKNGQQPMGAPTVPAQNGFNPEDYINGLNEQRKKQAYSSLEKQLNNSVSNLNQEKAGIQPKYYDARNQVAAGSQQSARNLAEFMAARGGTRSGANAQSEISRMGVQQGNLGSLGRQETAAYGDIARRESDVRNAFESDVASTNAGIEADKMNALLSQFNQNRQFGLQQDQFGLQQQGQQFNQGLQTNQYNQGVKNDTFNQNLQTKQFDYNVATDSRDFDYKAAQDSWANSFAKEQFTEQKAAQKWEQTFKTNSFQQDMKDAAASRGLQWASLNQRDKEFVADQTYREKTYQAGQTQQGVENTLNQDKLNWDKDPTNPANIGKPQPTILSSKDSTDNYYSLTVKMDTFVDPNTNKPLTSEQKLILIEANKENLSDSDYRKAKEIVTKGTILK